MHLCSPVVGWCWAWLGNASIVGGTIQALSAKLDIGGDLTLASVQDTSVTRGSQQGGGFSVSGSGGSVNANASNTNGASSWTVPSSIETIGSLNINVGKATTVTGAMMNSATGALTLSTNSLVVTVLKDVNQLNTTGGGFSAGFNTDAKTGKTSPTGSVNVNLENKDKQGETKGTIGAGNVTVRSLTSVEQSALLDTINRDPAKFTQVLVDNWDALRAEVDLTNIAALPDTLKNFGEALKRIDDFLNKSYPHFTEKQKRTFEKALIGGVDSTMIREQCLGRGYNRFNPINWIITPAFADGGECTIRVQATGLEFKIDKGDAKDCAEALEVFKKQNPDGFIVPTDVAAFALVAIPVIAAAAYGSLVVVQSNSTNTNLLAPPVQPNISLPISDDMRYLYNLASLSLTVLNGIFNSTSKPEEKDAGTTKTVTDSVVISGTPNCDPSDCDYISEPDKKKVKSGSGEAEVEFGKDSNQTFHANRHLIDKGLNPDKVQNLVLDDLKKNATNITSNTPSYIGTVNVNGVTVEYRAFMYSAGRINVGRMTIL